MDITSLKTVQNNFLEELKESAVGHKTSLPFIIHQLPAYPLINEGDIFEVIVIGGSIFKKALVKLENSQIKILKKEQTDVPFFRTREDLLHLLARELDQDVNVISLNFAYPLDPILESNKLDGILISGSKENSFDGLIGKKVGLEVEKYFLQTKKRRIKVAVANDTVCLLLAGLNNYSKDQLIAGVVGTGINFAFFLDQQKLVNLQAGNFSNLTLSEQAKSVDQYSNHPGNALFEKEVAGAYLYQHFNQIIKQKSISLLPLNSTMQLNSLTASSDREVSEIAVGLLQKSAALVAAMMAGMVEYKKQDCMFIMEGSLFWQSSGYTKFVQQYLNQLLSQLKAEFVKIEDSSIFGAANLVSRL